MSSCYNKKVMKRVDTVSANSPRSPWWAIGAGIIGLIAGYTLVMGPTVLHADDLARCPCKDGECGATADNS